MNETLLWEIISVVLLLMLIYMSYGNMQDINAAYENGKLQCLNDQMNQVLKIQNGGFNLTTRK